MSVQRASNTPATAGSQGQIGAARRWSELCDQCLPAIYGYIFGEVGNREDAEHLTTQVFTAAARTLPNPDDLHDVSQLLCRLAREHVAEHLRQFYAPAMADGTAEDAPRWETLLDARADGGRAAAERVEQMLGRVPASARDLLTRRLLAGQSLETIAPALHLTLAQARQLQYEALREASHASQTASVVSVAQVPRAEPCCP